MTILQLKLHEMQSCKLTFNSLIVCVWFVINWGYSLKPWRNGLASRRKFAKPELAYGLAKDGQMDSQVGKKRKFHALHWLMCFYNNRLLAINLC